MPELDQEWKGLLRSAGHSTTNDQDIRDLVYQLDRKMSEQAALLRQTADDVKRINSRTERAEYWCKQLVLSACIGIAIYFWPKIWPLLLLGFAGAIELARNPGTLVVIGIIAGLIILAIAIGLASLYVVPWLDRHRTLRRTLKWTSVAILYAFLAWPWVMDIIDGKPGMAMLVLLTAIFAIGILVSVFRWAFGEKEERLAA
jgi:uncharacterized membrane protein YhaH (DUF805 family)